MRIAILAAGAAAALFGGPAWAGCSVPHFNFFPGRQIEATMSADSGQSCSLRLRASATSRFDKVAIVVRPRHGTASTVGGGISYKSAAGYAGNDAFVFSVTGKMKTGSGTARIRVAVTVAGDGTPAIAGVPAPPPVAGEPARRPVARVAPARTNSDSAARRECLRQYPGSWDPQRRVWVFYSWRHHYHFIDCLGRHGKGAGS
jgi:hypothetical protein